MTSAAARPFSEVDAILREAEARCDLLSYLFDGWSAWVLLRWGVAMRLARLSMGAAQHALPGRERLVLSLADLTGYLRLTRRRILALTSTSALLDEEHARYKDGWMDEVLLRVGSVAKVELVSGAQFLERRRRALVPGAMTTTLMDGLTSVLIRGRPLPAGAATLSGALKAALDREFGPDAPSEQAIRLTLAVFYWRKRLWRRVLARVSPEVVLVADPGNYALVAAASEAGCPVAELQHGIVDRHNPAYSWSAAAAGKRSTMPLPHRVLLYGEHWRRELAGNGFWGDTLRVVGNARVEQFRRRRSAATLASGPRRVLFTSQGLAVPEAARFLAQTLGLLAGRGHTELTVKLHPVYDQDPEPYRVALQAYPDARILRATEGPSTFELLVAAQLHASISSATHYDALGLGVPTVVLALPSHETVISLVNAGHARLATVPGELAAAIEGSGETLSDPRLGDLYFRAGAVENIMAELEDVCRGARLR